MLSPVNFSSTLLPDRSAQSVNRTRDLVMLNAEGVQKLYVRSGNNLGLANIITSMVGLQDHYGNTIASGIRINSKEILLPGHAVSSNTASLIRHNQEVASTARIKTNFLPHRDIAIASMQGSIPQYAYYAGGPFGNEDYLLFFHKGKLMFKEILVSNGQMIDETVGGLSGAVIVSKDPFGEFKVTGFHVGDRHVLSAEDMFSTGSVSIQGSRHMNEPELARWGGYYPEARYSFSDKGKTEGYDVLEKDNQGKSLTREGSVTFYNLEGYKAHVSFSSMPNSPETSKLYHRNPGKYYKEMGKKIEEKIKEKITESIKNGNDISTSSFEFTCPLNTDGNASGISISHLATNPKKKK